MARVCFPVDIFDALAKHLRSRPEGVAFMLSSPPEEDGSFRIRDLRIVHAERFDHQSDDYAEPDDELRGEVIRWAWEAGACLIEAHSHGRFFLPARFSGFDFDQFEEWVPHVRWRLAGRPYAALVFAGEEIDGLAWLDSSQPEAIEAIVVDGREPIETTGQSAVFLRSRR
jgi:hypothetical protein